MKLLRKLWHSVHQAKWYTTDKKRCTHDAQNQTIQCRTLLLLWTILFSQWFSSERDSQWDSQWLAVFAFVIYFLRLLPVCLHISKLVGLPLCFGACMSICLHFCLSVAQVLWDCHKMLIAHMTSPTSCLPCILGLSGLKNPFTRLPLPPPPLTPILRCLFYFPSISPHWVCDGLAQRSCMICESKLLTFGICRNHSMSGSKVFETVHCHSSCSLQPALYTGFSKTNYMKPAHTDCHATKKPTSCCDLNWAYRQA